MTKSELFDIDLQDLALHFKVLSHPARLAILKYLAEAKVCISGDISEELPLSRTTVQQHLAELKRMGFIQGAIKGVSTNYCLNPAAFELLKNKLDMFLTDIHCQTIQDC
ncbi:MAG: metalloregulator ArsR/SmtB family transcription factor [Bacteroidales bacterium]|nr:metalloregulator ArsR/SmtB family transcription factor [Bacteroidales bacterium]